MVKAAEAVKVDGPDTVWEKGDGWWLWLGIAV
jgi:hypothetical protein